MSPGFAWEWSIVLPTRELSGGGDWRDWVAATVLPRKKGQSRARLTPGATVEVVERFLDERKERALEFNATWAPVLARSFQLGWDNSYGYQVLGEFMSMTAADLRPPTIPSVFYNGLIPYWVQQGWGSQRGIQVTVSESPRPIMLYPGRR